MNIFAVCLDCVLVLVIGILALIGMKKGFFRGLVGIFGIALVTLVSVMFSGVVSNALNNAFGTTDALTNFFTNYFNGIGGFGEVVAADQLEEVIATTLNMPVYLVHIVIYKLFPVTITEGQTIAQILGSSFAPMLMDFVVGTILFIVATLILNSCTKLFTQAVDKVPMLSYSNGLLGMLLGALKGLIIVVLIAYILSFLPYSTVQTAISESALFSRVSEYFVPRLALLFAA